MVSQKKNAPTDNGWRADENRLRHGQLSNTLNRLPGMNGTTSPPVKPV
jgi:hypothetical protein